jgi:hypothetical protein
LVLTILARTLTDPDKAIDHWLDSAAEVRDALAGPAPTPLEWLACEQAAIAWFDWARCSMTRDAGETFRAVGQGRGSSWRRTEYLDRRVDRAHRRLLASLRTLANIRRIDITAIQINMGAEGQARMEAGRRKGGAIKNAKCSVANLPQSTDGDTVLASSDDEPDEEEWRAREEAARMLSVSARSVQDAEAVQINMGAARQATAEFAGP